MLFDRILEDSLGFIRRRLWSQSDGKMTKKPYQPTESVSGEFGFIYLLDGRDTPRAVRTWMYTPKRQNLNSARMVATSVPMDLHIYTDFLGPLPGNKTEAAAKEREERSHQRQQGQPLNTHRLQILKASHFLNANGFYDYELVFWKEFDFYPSKDMPLSKNHTEKVIAIKFTDALAFKCLSLAAPLELEAEDWGAVTHEVVTDVRERMRRSP